MSGPPADLRELRFRRDVERLHRLGPRAIYELLSELGARYTQRTEIERLVGRYSRIDPLALRLAVGDQMPAVPFRALTGGRG
jgi:hypothetical protein